MTRAHDVAGSDDSDAQFVIIFLHLVLCKDRRCKGDWLWSS
jgi:hypothetical protein